MGTVTYGRIAVRYTSATDGGGRTVGQDLVLAVARHIGRVGRVCEFACGPGFIGFSLLARGLCDSVCFLDVNPAAIDLVRETTSRNHLRDRVSARVSDALDGVPAGESWDLVIGNPPNIDEPRSATPRGLKRSDPGRMLHRRFYQDVRRFLKPGGSVMLLEDLGAAPVDLWKGFVEGFGLEFVRTIHLRHTERVVHAVRNILDHPDYPKLVSGAKVTLAKTHYDRYYVVWSRNPVQGTLGFSSSLAAR
jgi:methylase of polypeptide subunit release factors